MRRFYEKKEAIRRKKNGLDKVKKKDGSDDSDDSDSSDSER